MTRTATSTRAAGGSSRIDLLLQAPKDIDPAFHANCTPLRDWAKRINRAYYHQDIATIDIMRNAWAAALANLHNDVTKGGKVWECVRGPASACIVSLGRIGWDIHPANSWRVWIDRSGNEIDLCKTCPHAIRKTLHRDIAISLWTQSTHNQEVQDELGLWLEPTRAVVMGKDRQLGAAARSVAVGK